MANAIPVRVPGTGGPTLQYVLPANMMQFVQSVNAVIDNGAGGDTKPVLTVLDSTNEVIADVPQGRSIPAGDSGRATWALRLADEQDAEPSGAGDVSLLWEYTVPAGGQAVVDTNVDGPMAGLLLQTFRVLEVFGNGRFDDANATHGGNIRFNGDTGNHYDLITSEVTKTPPATFLANSFNVGSFGFVMPAANEPSGRSGSFALAIPNYASTLLNKAGTLQNFGAGGSGLGGTNSQLWTVGFDWHPLVPAGIDRLTFATLLGANYVEGSYFAVYGRR